MGGFGTDETRSFPVPLNRRRKPRREKNLSGAGVRGENLERLIDYRSPYFGAALALVAGVRFPVTNRIAICLSTSPASATSPAPPLVRTWTVTFVTL